MAMFSLPEGIFGGTSLGTATSAAWWFTSCRGHLCIGRISHAVGVEASNTEIDGHKNSPQNQWLSSGYSMIFWTLSHGYLMAINYSMGVKGSGYNLAASPIEVAEFTLGGRWSFRLQGMWNIVELWNPLCAWLFRVFGDVVFPKFCQECIRYNVGIWNSLYQLIIYGDLGDGLLLLYPHQDRMVQMK